MIVGARLLLAFSFLSGYLPMSTPAFASPNPPGLDVVQSFDEMIDQRDFEKAAYLVADDVVISTPFGKKSKERFLRELQGSRPVWSASEPGDDEHQCISQGTRKLGFLTVKLKRVVEVNACNKIDKITVTKQ